MKKVLKTTGVILGTLLLLLALLFGYWFLRPNRARVDANVVLETWYITDDNMHNSNTDLIQWQDQFYVAYVSSPYHFASDASVLHIKRSADAGRSWQEQATFNPPGEDIRDPKFAIVGQRLFLYALKNTNFIAEPYISVYAYTEDGTAWTAFETVPGLDGWLFWRPKTQDGELFYNAAYWYEHGEAILIQSTDGIQWERVATIYQGGRNDETEIEFLVDGRMIATGRLEYGEATDAIFGDVKGATLIAVAEPPYTEWTERVQSKVTRLDGPYLFTYHGRTYAVGRYQPDLGKSGLLTAQGSALARKRTALFEIREHGLAYLTDLPSAGDTSYVGLIVDGDVAYATYYTSPTNRDYPWVIGMMRPSVVIMARIDLKAMETLADSKNAQ
ncbi:MAG: hypothetical protein JXA89_22675 [Anaerolineae bacterium]|nr:hypothetical protein [Anaerolineae bacterium]